MLALLDVHNVHDLHAGQSTRLPILTIQPMNTACTPYTRGTVGRISTGTTRFLDQKLQVGCACWS